MLSVACSPGSYSPKGSPACTPCQPHFYQEDFGMQQCVRCPADQVTEHTGSTSANSCVGEILFCNVIVSEMPRDILKCLLFERYQANLK